MAAWDIEDPVLGVGPIYRQLGHRGLESIENTVPRLAELIEALIQQRA